MPTIQSKKYESYVHYVTVEQWQVFKDKGLDRRYTVIDDSDIQDTVIATPQAFSPISMEEMEKPVLAESEWSCKDLKNWLNNRDVKHHSGALKDELYQLYLDNQ